MKVKLFTMADHTAHEAAFDKWQKDNPGIRIVSKHICAHNPPTALKGDAIFSSYDNVYIYYETAGDVEYVRNHDTIQQDAQLDMCRDIARAIYNNPDEWKIYKQLKNAEQRRIFLLDEHNIPKADADMVQEILQLAKIGALRGMNLKEEHTK